MPTTILKSRYCPAPLECHTEHMLINDINTLDVLTGLVSYYSPEYNKIVTNEITIDPEKDFLVELFYQWRDFSKLPVSVTLKSFDKSFGNEEEISLGSSVFVEHTQTTPAISLSISEEIYKYMQSEKLVMESLIKTVKAAYGKECMLTILIEGVVLYTE